MNLSIFTKHNFHELFYENFVSDQQKIIVSIPYFIPTSSIVPHMDLIINNNEQVSNLQIKIANEETISDISITKISSEISSDILIETPVLTPIKKVKKSVKKKTKEINKRRSPKPDMIGHKVIYNRIITKSTEEYPKYSYLIGDEKLTYNDFKNMVKYRKYEYREREVKYKKTRKSSRKQVKPKIMKSSMCEFCLHYHSIKNCRLFYKLHHLYLDCISVIDYLSTKEKLNSLERTYRIYDFLRNFI